MKLLRYILFEKNIIFIFQHWKWPALGTGTVPIVSAHFRSLCAANSAKARWVGGSDIGPMTVGQAVG